MLNVFISNELQRLYCDFRQPSAFPSKTSKTRERIPRSPVQPHFHESHKELPHVLGSFLLHLGLWVPALQGPSDNVSWRCFSLPQTMCTLAMASCCGSLSLLSKCFVFVFFSLPWSVVMMSALWPWAKLSEIPID